MDVSVQTLPDRLLSVSEVGLILGVNPRSVGRWIRAGDLPAVRLGSGPGARLRIHPDDLSTFTEPVGRRWPPRDFRATRTEQAAQL
jgi:excisionase family DNA binding protein